MNKVYSILACCALLIACSAKKVITGPAEEDVKRGSAMFSDISVENLKKGKTLMENHCGTCHGIKSPQSESVEEWKSIVPKMVAKVNKKSGTTTLSPEDEHLILMYLATMSTAPKN